MSTSRASSQWSQIVFVVGSVLRRSPVLLRQGNTDSQPVGVGVLSLGIFIAVRLSKGDSLRQIFHPARLGLAAMPNRPRGGNVLPVTKVHRGQEPDVYGYTRVKPIITPTVRTIDAKDVRNWRRSMYGEEAIRTDTDARWWRRRPQEPDTYHAPRSSYYRTPIVDPQQGRLSVVTRQHPTLDLQNIESPIFSPPADRYDEDKSPISPMTPATIKSSLRRMIKPNTMLDTRTSVLGTPTSFSQPSSAKTLLPPPDRWSLSAPDSVARLYISRPSSTDPTVVIKLKPPVTAQ